ncbi:Fic family protein [Faecalicoccus pleomorphus]|uniref:Fic family protein n=1 Tax=Faecalicoccus pleomorphus TaxID=1323 RepID=UPI001D7B7D6B|nr:Fic family protein [Faecalicoccus pleomorphus]MBM6807771.1 Fic family protein [Faecalicoccus pleomorphus]
MKNIQFKTKGDLDHLFYDFNILFAYHSGKIENDKITYHDTRDIFEQGSVKGYSGDLKTLMEIQNQKICFDVLKSYILKKEPISIELLKRVHYLLTRGTYDEFRYTIRKERPGEFKKNDYVTGVNEVGSDPEEVASDVLSLLSEIKDVSDENAFIAGVYFHARFENIHPFADGNGRVGRTLMNYYFIIHGIAPIIVHNEYRQLYYKALEQYDENEDLEPLKRFIEFEQEKTWNRTKKPDRKGMEQFVVESSKD